MNTYVQVQLSKQLCQTVVLGILLNLKHERLESHWHLAQFFIQVLNASPQLEWNTKLSHVYLSHSYLSSSPSISFSSISSMSAASSCQKGQCTTGHFTSAATFWTQKFPLEKLKIVRLIVASETAFKNKTIKKSIFIRTIFPHFLFHIKWKQCWPEFSAWTYIKNPNQAKKKTE